MKPDPTMCGIAALFSKHLSGDEARQIERMSERLAHRGPDDLGYASWSLGSNAPAVGRHPHDLTSANLWLAHRRLSILDTSDRGWQPMVSANGRYTIIFNGEIYNYKELREEFEKSGHVFRSNSDTEVLLVGLKAIGIAILPRLVGMFAFIFLDALENRLYLARDPFGMKPLYYSRTSGQLAIASEVKSLLTLPWIDRRANPQTVFDFLRHGQTDTDEGTFFDHVEQVKPAHWLCVELDNLSISKQKAYWSPGRTQVTDISPADAAEELRGLFMQSIGLHLRSDVPVGATLSGGIDSSSTVAAMRHVGGRALPIDTFSYIAEDASISEEYWVDIVSKETETRAHKMRFDHLEIEKATQEIVSIHDEPVMSSSVIAQLGVFRLAQQHGVKVTLDGQGADEYLAGYPTFGAARAADLLKHGNVFSALCTARNTARQGDVGLGGITQRAAQYFIPESLRSLALRIAGQPPFPDWLNANYFKSHDVAKERGKVALSNSSHLRHLMIQTLTKSSLPALLRYADRNSMSASVESRMPFLTTQLVDFVLSLPDGLILNRSGLTKSVFRKAMQGIVPAEILNRRDKVGFSTPQSAWLSSIGLGKGDSLSSERIRAVLNPELLSAHNKISSSHIWRSFSLAHWANHHEIRFS